MLNLVLNVAVYKNHKSLKTEYNIVWHNHETYIKKTFTYKHNVCIISE